MQRLAACLFLLSVLSASLASIEEELHVMSKVRLLFPNLRVTSFQKKVDATNVTAYLNNTRFNEILKLTPTFSNLSLAYALRIINKASNTHALSREVCG